MDDKTEKLRDYLSRQMGYNHLVRGIDEKEYYSRNMWILLEQHVKNFVYGTTSERWIVIPGLRGVGKTTLVAQIYSWIYKDALSNKKKINLLYISLDVVRNLGAGLLDVIDNYESLLAGHLENIPHPTLIFIDEVQVDAQWAQVLKTVYDRTNNVFLICTGSAATYLQLDADTAGRRAKIERLYPLSFTEYQMLAHKKLPTKNLKGNLLQICYRSASAKDAYESLQKMRSIADRAWSKYDAHNVEDYLRFGTLPFAFQRSPADTYQALMDNIDKVIVDDLMTDRRFNLSHSSTTTIKQLLTILADSSTTPKLSTLSDLLRIDVKNLSEMLGALVKAEVLIKVPSYGNNITITRNPVRYQFMSATLRNAYCNITGSRQTAESRKGQLLEDVASLHYYREFVAKMTGSLTYLYAKNDPGYCDFILKITNSHSIAIEFGFGRKTPRQVKSTLHRVDCAYGIVFSETPLQLHESDNIIMIPLKYFFLM